MSGRVWVQHPLFAGVPRLPAAPVCRACELVKGLGWVGRDGTVHQADPAPADAGVADVGFWWCSPECREHYLGRPELPPAPARLHLAYA